MEEALRRQIKTAIQAALQGIRWRPGKDVAHLQTRKERGHLPADATLDDYHAIIRAVLGRPIARVFVYRFGDSLYPTIVAEVEAAPWLVMLTSEGVMGTAFIVRDLNRYLVAPQFEWLGQLEEVMV